MALATEGLFFLGVPAQTSEPLGTLRSAAQAIYEMNS
jgi:hypothetical protein